MSTNNKNPKLFLGKHSPILILLAFLFLPGDGWAQQQSLRFYQLSVEDGLSQNTVTDILQDKQGYIWFATRDGLNKYDGYEFKIFRHDPNPTASLTSNNIQCLFQDSRGIMWIGTTDGGLTRYDPETEIFRNYIHDPKDSSSISSNYISAIVEDQLGNLWLGTAKGLNIFNQEQERFFAFRADIKSEESLSDDFINDILFDKNGLLWIGTENNGACVFDSQTQIFRKFRHDASNSQSIASARVQEIHQDKEGRIWFATVQGLSLYQPKTGQFTNTQVSDDVDSQEIITIEEDQFGNLWLGTARSGLFQRDSNTGQITRISFNDKNPQGLPDGGILELFRDRENNIWGGLNGLGIFRFDPNPTFRLYTDLEKTNSLSNSSVRATYFSIDSNLWVGSYGGLDFFNTITGEHKRYHYESEKWDLPSNNIYAFLPDGPTNLWIGMEGQGLVYFYRDKEQFFTYKHDDSNPNSIPDDFIYCMTRDELGRLWIGTGDGIAKIERSRGGILTSTNYFRKGAQNADVIRSLVVSEGINLWIGTENNGLYYFNSIKGSHEIFIHDHENPNSISSDAILSLYEESDTTLWIGTHGGGIKLL